MQCDFAYDFIQRLYGPGQFLRRMQQHSFLSLRNALSISGDCLLPALSIVETFQPGEFCASSPPHRWQSYGRHRASLTVLRYPDLREVPGFQKGIQKQIYRARYCHGKRIRRRQDESAVSATVGAPDLADSGEVGFRGQRIVLYHKRLACGGGAVL